MEKESENELIVRDYLARQRTKLANDRTLLSYIRTSLYFLVSGTALVKVEDLANIKEFGYLSFGISFVFFVMGITNFFTIRRKIKKGHYARM
ncbi:DUF202 domain-containing protein [Echinicola jeungdonensis]|uniref:DUF202 domain-containing protein n=1 Tax=Echinicola jeungdonensis TaxID=709343 RepID=A0ABV5J0D4_9BACT|nr:DUF202 domain-containing protein [Echinicola jeungdonensis]MDN3671114.1 DUF202 domain-containing protein [Echinicola jeungdonensis]